MSAATAVRTQTIAVTGASGLVGKVLVDRMTNRGATVKSIVRRTPDSYDSQIQWDVKNGFLNPERLEGLDVVVHLAGEPIAEGRWNDKKKARIRDSRIQGTSTLAKALAATTEKPKVLVSASAIGFYGDRGEEQLTEASPAGSGFLSDVCSGWEEATQPAVDAGIRVVNVRIGIVLTKAGGALGAMLMPFKMGVGGIMGNGKQFWSWVTVEDLVSIIEFAIANESISGPVNAVSPNPSTNREFTKAMGKALSRPTIFPMPGFAARIVIGEMADALLLSSARVVPQRLIDAGFEFQHAELDAALSHALS